MPTLPEGRMVTLSASPAIRPNAWFVCVPIEPLVAPGSDFAV